MSVGKCCEHGRWSSGLRNLMLGLVSLVMAACGGGSGGGGGTGTNISIDIPLSGYEVSPAVNTAGVGQADITVNDQTGVLSGTLTVMGLQGAPTVAHIHDGAAGTNGGVILALDSDINRPFVFTVPANTTLSAGDLAKLLGGQTYLQVHSAAHTAGEVRGQILPTTSNISRVAVPLSGQEVSTAVNTAGTGKGVLLIDSSTGDVFGAVSTRNLQGAATAGHLHSGAPGTNGAVMVILSQDGNDSNLFTVPASTTLNATDLASLLAGNTYLQIHSAAHATGEVRGQALLEGGAINRIEVPLSGEEVSTAVNTTGAGKGVLLVNNTTGDVFGALSTNNLQGTATAAHIHDGAPGINGAVMVILSQDSSDTNLYNVPASTTLSSSDLATLMAGNSYLQVHSTQHTTGEVRGQVLPEGSAVSRITVPLSGEEVSPAVNTTGAGQGVLLVNNASGALFGAVTTRNLQGSATAGHIHNGAMGTNGGVMVVLTQDGSDTDLFTVPANTILNTTDLTVMQSDSSYLQIHSTTNTAGEVRGQVLAEDSSVIRVNVALNGSEIVPPVTTPASGKAVMLVDVTTGEVNGGLTVQSLQGAGSAGHIHLGATGIAGSIALILSNDGIDTNLYQIPVASILSGTNISSLLNSEAYFQVHSLANAGGEVRGQIILPLLD